MNYLLIIYIPILLSIVWAVNKGSEARGDARVDSDMDFLIVLPMPHGEVFLAKQRQITEALLFEVELETGVEISPYVVPEPIWRSHPTTPFTINIQNEGIVV